MTKPLLLTKQKAAALLGISLSTFDRLRVRIALKPVELPLVKPIYFYRQDIEAINRAKHSVWKPEHQRPFVPFTPEPDGGDRILSLTQIKLRAGRKVKQTFKVIQGGAK